MYAEDSKYVIFQVVTLSEVDYQNSISSLDNFKAVCKEFVESGIQESQTVAYTEYEISEFGVIDEGGIPYAKAVIIGQSQDITIIYVMYIKISDGKLIVSTVTEFGRIANSAEASDLAFNTCKIAKK
jgi:hypothetical protein